MERDPVWKRRIDRDPELDIAQSVGGLALAETASEEDGELVEPSEQEVPEVPVPAATAPGMPVSSKRERRRQRRASRPHGRAR